MKSFTGFFLAIILSLTFVMNVNAQSAESIWLSASTTSYKAGETVIVTVNGSSATPIQGFTFQIRYDPDCLRPVNASSSISGMNALPLPQLAGLVDGSYASTTPQTVNGVLAEVRFTTLKGCQTSLTLESAALAIRNQSGFAAPLSGVTIGERSVALNIDSEVFQGQADQPLSGSVLPLEPAAAPEREIPLWVFGLAAVLLIVGVIIVALIFRKKPAKTPAPARRSQAPTLQIKRGPQAGRSIILNKLPWVIGRDPQSDLCLNDPNITGQHAKIFSNNDTFYLMDLGGETYINGRAVKRASAVLKSGDVVRLGKSALLVFGS